MFEERILVPPHRVVPSPVYQGHYVPRGGYYPSFKFEVDTPVTVDSCIEPEEHPPGATAQNGMTEVMYYQCQACEAVVHQDDVDTHRCD